MIKSIIMKRGLGNIFIESTKSLLIVLLRILAILISWTSKLVGVVFQKLGESIEKTLLK